jgi:ketosteroid isomerase-like protein
MDLGGRQTEVSTTERTIPNDPDRTLAAPRFDEKSVQRALPAVPLTRRGRARTSSLPVILLCVAAGLIGGLVVAFALTLWKNHDSPRAEAPPAWQQTADAPANPAVPENAAAAAPTPQEANADARGPQPDGQTTPAQTEESQPKGSDGAHTQEAAGAVRDAAGAVAAGAAQAPPKTADDVAVGERVADAGAQDELRAALGDWIAATNARDINRQMKFYAPTVGAFYLARNASRESVRAEKARVFANAGSVDVRASAPEITLGRDGQTAVMRFRKRYRIDGEESRAGEVLQELRWRRTNTGWKIVGERDLRVLQ